MHVCNVELIVRVTESFFVLATASCFHPPSLSSFILYIMFVFILYLSVLVVFVYEHYIVIIVVDINLSFDSLVKQFSIMSWEEQLL